MLFLDPSSKDGQVVLSMDLHEKSLVSSLKNKIFLFNFKFYYLKVY